MTRTLSSALIFTQTFGPSAPRRQSVDWCAEAGNVDSDREAPTRHCADLEEAASIYAWCLGHVVLIFSLAAGPSSLRSLAFTRELWRTRRSLGEGGHPRRELTPASDRAEKWRASARLAESVGPVGAKARLMPRLGFTCPCLGMAAGAVLFLIG